MMFNQLESSDKREREAKTRERLNMLKLAYENGYFNEEGSESVALCGSHALADGAVSAGKIDDGALILVFDGDGPNDSPDMAGYLGRWHERLWRGIYHAGSEDCPTCGKPRTMFVNGDCPRCTPPTGAADERRCAACYGTGILFNGAECHWCAETGNKPTT